MLQKFRIWIKLRLIDFKRYLKDHFQDGIPFRLKILLWLTGILCLALLFQLFNLQIKNGNNFQAEVSRTSNTIESNNVPRGSIYDTNGKVLVANKAHQAIAYTKGINVSASDMYNVARNLSHYLKVDTKGLTKDQEVTYYLANINNFNKVAKNIEKRNSMSSMQLQDAAEAYCKNHYHFNNDQFKNAAEIFSKLNGAYALSTTYIKENGVTDKEVAEVGAHLSSMPGVKISTSWSRTYPNGNSIKDIAGRVTTEKEGLPSNQVLKLLSEGYSRNDSVGASYLEQEYEPVLRGTKSQTRVQVNGNKITKQVKQYPGKPGANLVLTLNQKFQQDLQNLIKSSTPGGTSQGVYAVVMNPNTGAIYGMAGEQRNYKTGKEIADPLGVINQPMVMGSIVKPGLFTSAFQAGVITPEDNTLIDHPIWLKGISKLSTDWNNNGSYPLNAALALETSSNSYSMQVAMKMAGFKYYPGESVYKLPKTMFQIIRNALGQYGLGVKTGVDIPGESAGLEGPTTGKHIGSALPESFGNYDSYTVMQLGQYISTLANGGYRLRPYIVKQIRSTTHEGGLGKVEYNAMPKVLNYVSASKQAKNIIKQGMYDVVYGNSPHKTGANFLEGLTPKIVAKTGTAETITNGQKTVTSSMISYAPINHPKVAIALAMPGLPETMNSYLINQRLMVNIYKLFLKDVLSSNTSN